MKKLIIMLVLLTGCTTNGVYDNGKTWALIGGVALGSAVLIAQQDDAPAQKPLNCYWVIAPSGNHQVCR